MKNNQEIGKAIKEKINKLAKGKTKLIAIAIPIAIALIIILATLINNTRKLNYTSTPEIARSMTYNQVQKGEEAISGTDYVTFDAFFLRDLNGDGIAEGIRGMCRELGKTDTLYMELNVLTNGYLENGVITINNTNAYFQTTIPKDNEIAENAIGTNTKTIKLNTINNGTQKLLTAIARSGDYSYSSSKASAIGTDTTNYSKINSITLTGTHVAEDGTRTEIEKTVEFNIDWYGTVKAEMPTYLAGSRNLNQEQNIETAINEETGTFTVKHNIGIQEVNNMLNIKKAYIEGEIPELNGYAPAKVEITGTNVTYTYDETSRKFTAQKEAVVNEEGVITSQAYDGTYSSARYNKFKLTITYPLEAYQILGTDTVESKITVVGHYEGYNNSNTEFRNPYKSNEVQATFILTITPPVEVGPVETRTKFDITIGKYISTPSGRYMISKEKPLKIYNGISEKEIDDTYLVRWYGYTGTNGQANTMIMKETKNEANQVSDEFRKIDGTYQSMEELTTNVGIYFSNPVNLLGEEGFIKVYDDETDELIETFTSDNWNDFNSSTPYQYDIPVKHIRIETSSTNASSYLYVYNIKELDDEYITEKYTEEEFDNLQYIRSTLTGYLNETVITDTHTASYETPYAVVSLGISKTTISTQETERNMKITITANANENANQVKWKNGAFLLKLPQDIVDVEINNVTINNDNVKITSYEQYEENGIDYIKINTENATPTTYDIVVDCNITPDPRIATTTESFELYAHNENAVTYWNNTKDIYDVNNNLNKEEVVAKLTRSISLVSPNSLLTSQTITNYNSEGTTTIAPKIAEVSKEQRTANINIEINNNYSSTISDVKILGRVPFEGNKYTINNAEMGSTFTATMQNTGLQLPEALKEVATIYYSENGEAINDLNNEENGWTTLPEDYSRVKSYLIDLGDHSLAKGEKHTFTYTLNVPEGLNYNQVSYSHHAIYFSLDTESGKYKTQTEPNKIGLMIAKQYDLELTKYQTGKENKVSGATYIIIEEGQEERKTKVTAENGTLTLNNLYIDRTYIIKEIKTPSDYELNTSEIKFSTSEENGELKVTLLTEENTVKSIKATQPQEDEGYKVQIEVEDEVKARLQIIKTQKTTEENTQETTPTFIRGARFKVTGKNFETGRTITTNKNGEVSIKGLSIGEEYTIEEVKSAEGYYLNASQTKFTITNNNGEYALNLIEGEVKTSNLTEEGSIPTININIENEKIPTYNLQILKVVKGEETRLQGAKFNLYKGTEKLADYTTDENGSLTIENLYQYETEKNIDQTYTLKEVLAPEGYAAVKDITFKVENKEGLLTMDITSGTIKEQTVEGNTVTITIEDTPSFKLIKKDGETGEVLPNTKFAIYNVDDGIEQLALDVKYNILGTKEIINGKEYHTLTTNEKGEIEANLREGLYKAVEVKASDDKYDITDNEYYFGIGVSREATEGFTATWATSIGTKINSLVETSDGGYILGGCFENYTIKIGDYTLTNARSGYSDGMLIKYSKEGTVEWATSVGGKNADEITLISETSDGGYIIGGEIYSSIQVGEYKLTYNKREGCYTHQDILIKYSKNGEVEWATTIGGDWFDQINSLTATSDGGYMVGGYFISDSIQVGDYILKRNDSGYADGMVIKYSKDGSVEWATSVGGSGVDHIELIFETSDGGYIAGGYAESSSIQIGDYTLKNSNTSTYSYARMIMKFSMEGSVEWAKTTSSSNGIKFGYTTRDEGYIIIYENNILTKYNRKGEKEWETLVKGRITSINQTNDEGYIVGGDFSSSSIQVGDYTLTNISEPIPYDKSKYYADGIITKYSKEGTIEWATSIGGNDDEVITSVIENSNGKYIVGVTSESNVVNMGNYQIAGGGILIELQKKEINNPITTKANVIGGSDSDYIEPVSATSDGGYIVGGSFKSSIQVGEYTLTSNGNSDGMLIKYNKFRKVEWAISIGGEDEEKINSVSETSDGGYIVGGHFKSSTIQVGNCILTNNGDSDGMVIKYSREGTVEWATSAGGNSDDKITSVSEINDRGYIVGGYFWSTSGIQIGDYILKRHSNGYTDGMLIRYSRVGVVEWATSIGKRNVASSINSVLATSDGGYIVGGNSLIKYSRENEVEWTSSVGNIRSISSTSDGGYIVGGNSLIKYSRKGEMEWTEAANINSVSETNDGGYIVVGNFSSHVQVGDYKLINNGSYDGKIVKYSKEGKVEWAKGIGGSSYDYINSVTVLNDGTIIAGGYFNSSTIETDGKTLTNNGSYDGMILSVAGSTGVPEVQELVVENRRKEFKITTGVKEIDGIKGGTISGENQSPYETVKYGDSNTKEIIMTPEEGYEIISITVNDEEYKFTANEDGTYTMPTFENIQENKHIVVTYSLKSNKITINKVDSNTKAPLTGVKFKLDQIEERTNPENVIGKLTANGASYAEITNTENKITNVLGELTNNGDYYFVQQEDGSYVPTNSKTYQTANGGTAGIGSTTANSYIQIDLTGKEGTYAVVVNANISSESSCDFGYATITQTSTAPEYNMTTGQLFSISGTSTSVTTAKDYASMVLEGGNTYYLHLGYLKDPYTDTGNDQLVINSIKVYEANAVTYNFIEENGEYKSNNQEKASTVANSYIPIDLTEYTGKYNLTINAKVSSESYRDYGYATITTNQTAPAYNNITGRFVYISGTSTNASDYTTILQGGQMYYLHLGYRKDASTDTGDDTFTVSNIRITPNDSELYHLSSVETNSEGQAITQIPYGKYALTEINAPEGYEQLKESVILEFRKDENKVAENSNLANVTVNENGEFVVENVKLPKVIVHHYLKDEAGNYTTTKLAEDDILIGRLKTSEEQDKEEYTYVSKPHLDLKEYDLERDASGNYVIPKNATGKYTQEEIEVTYYYETKDIPLVVNHYIEGTIVPVTLANGEQVQAENRTGKKGEIYTTSAIPETELNEKYYLVEIPSNSTGTYEDDIITVNYYYRVKKYNITTEVQPHEEIQEQINEVGEIIQVPVMVAGGTITGQNETPYEIVEYGDSNTKEIIMTPEKYYEITSITVNGEKQEFKSNEDGTYTMSIFENIQENKHIVVTYASLLKEITIDKIDRNTKEPLEGVEFKLDQIDEREKPENVIGEAVSIGDTYTESEIKGDEITGVLGELTANAEYYFVEQEDGSYIPTNGNTYQIANGGTGGLERTIANSYVKIDLTEKEGNYAVLINANVSSTEGADYGYALINDTTELPMEDVESKIFMEISGTIEVANYTSTILEGGNTYYLHLIYAKASNSQSQDDQLVINSIKVYEAESTSATYGFVEENGKYVSNNKEKLDTTAISYIPIDLTNYTDSYNLSLTASISSEESYDYGTVGVTTKENDFTEVLTRTSGNNTENCTIELKGGRMYYLILIYQKDEIVNEGEDTFTISNIRVTPTEKELYHVESIQTNDKGQAITKIPYGKYLLTEVNTVDKYELLKEPVAIEVKKDGNIILENNNTANVTVNAKGEFVVENNKLSKVIVHHYIEGTQEKVPSKTGGVVEDIEKIEIVGNTYETTPSEEVAPNYELVAEPENATGEVTEEAIEVIYYYRPIEPDLTSKVEKTGTEKVTSKAATVYYEVKFTATVNNFVGKAKVTMVDILPYPIDESKSELNGGTYDAETRTITWEEEIENIDTFNAVEAKEIAITKVLELSYQYENLDNVAGSMLNTVHSKIELQEPKLDDPETYETVKQEEKDAEKETLIEIPAQVIVHHYFYDAETDSYTTTKLAEDNSITGIVGQEYTTNPSNEVAANYVLVAHTDNTTGKMTENSIEVIYYYSLTTPTVTNTIEKTATANKVVEETITNEITTRNEATGEDEITTEETKVQYPVLTKEDGQVTYNINYKANIENYIGKVTVEVVDTLPAKIDPEKSELNGGEYNETTKTITWKLEIPNVDTYANQTGSNEFGTYENGTYKLDFTKQIKLVYVDQDVNSDLINTVTGTTKVYYPEEHPTKGGNEQKEETTQDTATVKQEYKVNLIVEKVWEDNNNLKGKRPESVKIIIKEVVQAENEQEETEQKEVTTQVLSESNNWTYTAENLPKYDQSTGKKLTYTVEETEVNDGDLEYYETSTIIQTENSNTSVGVAAFGNPDSEETTQEITQTGETTEITTYKFTVKNTYKLLNTDLNTQITKTGTKEITTSAQPVDYNIHFTAEIANYIGTGKVTIVDILPYEIDETNSNLNGGIYNAENKTITWQEDLPHINTEVSGESYQVNVTKQISVLYKNLSTEIENTKLNKLTNTVKGKLELYETDQKDEKQTTFDTNINVTGKVIVRYVDKTTGQDITVKVQNDQGELVDTTYNYEINGKVGENYTTELKDIENYVYVESTNNETGIIKEQDQEVIYYYEKAPAKVIVKYQDKAGNTLAEDIVIEGKVDDPYTTEAKDIENYKLTIIPDNKEGTMQKGTITVIYVYEKIPARVIVKYLEKGTEKELLPEGIAESYVGDKYETQRKAIDNYRKAEPEPNNASGTMKLDEETNNTITVIYYYERIPSGNVTVKYVDEETKEEITYEDKETGEEKTYGYEIKGNVGDKYNTEEKEIPYYNLVKVPENKQGELTESGETVVYYYRKQKFNMQIEKEITKVVINGEEKKVKDGKLMKIEVPESQIATTDLSITYTIKVRNTEELAGTAKVQELIPQGYILAANNPEYWTKTAEGNLETTIELQPGEEKVLEVLLKWNNTETNFGEANNTAKLTNLENEANYEETTTEDNTSSASLVTSVKTGQETKILEMVLKTIAINGALILIILIPAIVKKKKE